MSQVGLEWAETAARAVAQDLLKVGFIGRMEADWAEQVISEKLRLLDHECLDSASGHHHWLENTLGAGHYCEWCGAEQAAA